MSMNKKVPLKPFVGMKVSTVKYKRDRNGNKIIGKKYGTITQVCNNFVVVKLDDGYSETFKLNELRYIKEGVINV